VFQSVWVNVDQKDQILIYNYSEQIKHFQLLDIWQHYLENSHGVVLHMNLFLELIISRSGDVKDRIFSFQYHTPMQLNIMDERIQVIDQYSFNNFYNYLHYNLDMLMDKVYVDINWIIRNNMERE
jgi:hypothetical protein